MRKNALKQVALASRPELANEHYNRQLWFAAIGEKLSRRTATNILGTVGVQHPTQQNTVTEQRTDPKN